MGSTEVRGRGGQQVMTGESKVGARGEGIGRYEHRRIPRLDLVVR